MIVDAWCWFLNCFMIVEYEMFDLCGLDVIGFIYFQIPWFKDDRVYVIVNCCFKYILFLYAYLCVWHTWMWLWWSQIFCNANAYFCMVRGWPFHWRHRGWACMEVMIWSFLYFSLLVVYICLCMCVHTLNCFDVLSLKRRNKKNQDLPTRTRSPIQQEVLYNKSVKQSSSQ